MAKVALLIQARSGSTRLPLKIFMPFGGYNSILEAILSQVSGIQGISEFYLSTSDQPEEEKLIGLATGLGMKVARGPVDDIVTRISSVGTASGADYIVRLWGDCPFVCPDIIEEMLHSLNENAWEFCSNADLYSRTTPPGLDVEIYSSALLKQMDKEIQKPKLREFPVEYVKKTLSEETYGFWNLSRNHSDYHLTIDYREDLEAGDRLFRELRSITLGKPFRSGDLIHCIDASPGLLKNFSKAARNIEFKKFLDEGAKSNGN